MAIVVTLERLECVILRPSFYSGTASGCASMATYNIAPSCAQLYRFPIYLYHSLCESSSSLRVAEILIRVVLLI